MVINGVASSWSQIGGVITSEISNSNANNPTSTTSSNLSNQSNVTGGTSLILINGAPASWKTAGTVINSSLGTSNDGTNHSAVENSGQGINGNISDNGSQGNQDGYNTNCQGTYVGTAEPEITNVSNKGAIPAPGPTNGKRIAVKTFASTYTTVVDFHICPTDRNRGIAETKTKFGPKKRFQRQKKQ